LVPQKLTFSPLSRRQIEADFSGGHITSDAGLLLLREVDKQHRLTQRLAETLTDQRDSTMIRHQLDTGSTPFPRTVLKRWWTYPGAVDTPSL